MVPWYGILEYHTIAWYSSSTRYTSSLASYQLVPCMVVWCARTYCNSPYVHYVYAIASYHGSSRRRTRAYVPWRARVLASSQQNCLAHEVLLLQTSAPLTHLHSRTHTRTRTPAAMNSSRNSTRAPYPLAHSRIDRQTTCTGEGVRTKNGKMVHVYHWYHGTW